MYKVIDSQPACTLSRWELGWWLYTCNSHIPIRSGTNPFSDTLLTHTCYVDLPSSFHHNKYIHNCSCEVQSYTQTSAENEYMPFSILCTNQSMLMVVSPSDTNCLVQTHQLPFSCVIDAVGSNSLELHAIHTCGHLSTKYKYTRASQTTYVASLLMITTFHWTKIQISFCRVCVRKVKEIPSHFIHILQKDIQRLSSVRIRKFP